MHILLTDLLCCPRCGPRFGLILLGDRIEDRRVLEGLLGCPNCRERYPVRDGFADLRAPPRSPFPRRSEGPSAVDDEEAVLRTAALLGVREGPGYLLLAGPAARGAGALAAMLEGIEVVTLDPDLRSWEENPGVTRMASGPDLPFFSRRIRGILLEGGAGAPYLEDALRVVGPGGRIAVLDPEKGSRNGIRKRMEEAGLDLVLDDPRSVVGRR